MKRILIIDDELSILEVLEMRIESLRPDWEINTTTDAIRALDILEKNTEAPFNLILSDIKMPKMDGIDFSKICLEKYPQIPVILISGFIPSSLNVISIAVTTVLEKTVGAERLIEEMERAFAEKEEYLADANYFERRVIDIKTGIRLPLNLYIKISQNKFIKYMHEGDPFTKERQDGLCAKGLNKIYFEKEAFLNFNNTLYIPIRTSTLSMNKPIPFLVYIHTDFFHVLLKSGTLFTSSHQSLLKEKNLKRLYIEEKDEPLYQKYLDSILDKLMLSEKNSTEEQISALAEVSVFQVKTVYSSPSSSSIQNLSTTKNRLLKFLDKNEAHGLDQFLNTKHREDTFKHALDVSALCLTMYKTLFSLSPQNKEQPFAKVLLAKIDGGIKSETLLSTSALLHGIGKQHCQKGDGPLQEVEIAEKTLLMIDEVDPKIAEIVYQHKECHDGSGPLKLTSHKISIFAQFISLANFYINLRTLNLLSSQEAISVIKENEGKFNKYLTELLLFSIK